MGLLSDLYQRSLHPGMLDNRRARGVVQDATLAPAVHGMRVEIPRVERRTPPFGLLFETGFGGSGHGYDGYRSGELGPARAPGQALADKLATAPVTTSIFPQPVAPGQRRTFNLSVTAETAGSLATQEIRVTPTIGRSFRVTELNIYPIAGVTVGQYLDIIVASNADMSDSGAFFGSSLFENPSMISQIPTPDNQRGLPVPIDSVFLKDLGPIFQAGQQIKLVVFFVAPAITMPDVSVTIVVEEVVEAATQVPQRKPPKTTTPSPTPPIATAPTPPPPTPTAPLPSPPEGTLPSVPLPNYALVQVIQGVQEATSWIPTYDASGKTTGYIQDPIQAAQWTELRTTTPTPPTP